MAPAANATIGAEGTGPTGEEASGIIPDFVYGSELNHHARRAYREFRRTFLAPFYVTAVRRVGDWAFGTIDRIRKRRPYSEIPKHNVGEGDIAFIGAWDTVDAYGLPVDELTNGIDQWVWPLSMPDLILNPIVKRACHVLALDDERNTFHPVLWDEEATNEPQDCTDIDQERITQIWFAGMHSNVGGGYPDDALSGVSLAWMAQQAEKQQLCFMPNMLNHHTTKADPFGRVYDSRSGLKAYYRYKPRRMDWLTDGQPHEQLGTKGSLKVKIGRPKIHESVFTRMSAAPEAYAPIVFPKEYAVVMEDGRILDGNENPFEPSAAAVKRFASQERVWDLVWWRRVLYFATVAVTLVALVVPVVYRGGAAPSTRDAGIAGGIVAALGEWLPSFASWWVEYYTAKPWELILYLAILFAMWRRGKWLQSRIRDEMRGVWQKVIPPTVGHYTELEAHTSWLKSLRLSNWYQGFSARWRHKALPALFGLPVLTCFIVTLVCLAALASRVPFEVASAMGAVCPEGAAEGLRVGQSTGPLILESRDFCSRTGVLLEENKHYEFRFTISSVANEPWQDGDVQVKYSAEGFTSRTPGLTFCQQVLFTVAIPVRRVLSAGWFVPLARVGDRGGTQYRLDGSTTNITPKATGELFLFVNDSIAPFGISPPAWGWDASYMNNGGTAIVTVTRLPDAR